MFKRLLTGLVALAATLLLPLHSEGQILTFDFVGLVGSEATAVSSSNDARLSSSTISRGAGTTAAANGDRFNATAWTTNATLDATDYFEFTVTPLAGKKFTVTSVVVQHQRSGTGPVKFALRSSDDAYASSLGGEQTCADLTSTTQTSTFTFTMSDKTAAVTFRLYAYAAEAAGGTWGPEGTGSDIVVNGSTADISGCTPPVTQASGPIGSDVAPTAMTVSWTRGSGDQVLVVARSGSAVDTDPSDGSSYTGNAAFGSGSQIGTGNYVIYKGTGTSVTLTGLTANTPYHFAAYELTSSGPCYKADQSVGNQTTASAASDIVAVTSSESTTVSSVVNDAPPLTSVTGVQVWQFKVRDGGTGLNDADALPTVVTGITLAQATGNSVDDWDAATNAVELFDGATRIAGATVTVTQVQFTGLSVSVTDGTEKTLSVRLSLATTLNTAGNNDGDDFGFSLSAANLTVAATGSSGKAAFTAAASANGSDVIAIVATELRFVQGPTDATVGVSMLPAVTVGATDANGNRDLGFISDVQVSSTGSLTGTPVTVAAASGLATFGTLVHSATGTTLTLTAERSPVGDWDKVSGTFNIWPVFDLSTGNVAVLGLCSNTFACGGTAAGDDEVSFVCFVDIPPSASIDITDNGWQRTTANKFGDTEGAVRARRTGATIPAGTVITFQFRNNGIHTATSPDANWSFTSITSSGSALVMNTGGDQFFIMQGGTWSDGTVALHDASYSGDLLFAFNSNSSWTDFGASTQQSGLPAGLDCFSMMPNAGASDHLKYFGDMTPASQAEWISRVNDPDNWQTYAGCATYYAASPQYHLGYSISVVAGGFTPGVWTGARDNNWFDCGNWQNLRIPTDATDVSITSKPNDPLVDVSGAVCRGMSLSSSGLLTINGTGSLGVHGNWDNDATLTHTAGTVTFEGTSAQTLGGSSVNSFYNLSVNGAGVTLIDHDVPVTNLLTLTSGVVTTGTLRVDVTTSSTSAVSGGSSSSFVYGGLRRAVANGGTYSFPVGHGTASTDYHPADLLSGTSGLASLEVRVTTITESGADVDVNLSTSQDGTPITDVLESAEWALTPNAVPTGTYGVRLHVDNTGLSAADDNKFCTLKRVDGSTTYADWTTLSTTTTIPSTGSAGRTYSSGYAERTGLSSFSRFAIGRGVNAIPVELLWFRAEPHGDGVETSWATASEDGCDHFDVERSADGTHFETVISGVACGSRNTMSIYSVVDDGPLVGISYYRLRKVDVDGKVDLSPMVAVDHRRIFRVTDTPDVFSVSGEGMIFVIVCDVTGRVMSLKSGDGVTIYKSGLRGGIYVVTVTDRMGTQTYRFVVTH